MQKCTLHHQLPTTSNLTSSTTNHITHYTLYINYQSHLAKSPKVEHGVKLYAHHSEMKTTTHKNITKLKKLGVEFVISFDIKLDKLLPSKAGIIQLAEYNLLEILQPTERKEVLTFYLDKSADGFVQACTLITPPVCFNTTKVC